MGQDIITMCTKCKLELDHVVVFHNEEGIIEKVEIIEHIKFMLSKPEMKMCIDT